MEKFKRDVDDLLRKLKDFGVYDLVDEKFGNNTNNTPGVLLRQSGEKVWQHLNNLDKLIEKERKEASAKTANDIGWNAGGINW